MILQDSEARIAKPCGTGAIVNIGKLDYAFLYETEKFLNGIALIEG